MASQLNREIEYADDIEWQAMAAGFSGYENWNETRIRGGYRLKNAELIITRQAVELNEDHVVALRFVMRQAQGIAELGYIRAATNLGAAIDPTLFSFLARGELRLVHPVLKLDENALILISGEPK